MFKTMLSAYFCQIIETQSAVLSNYEVHKHLKDMKIRYEHQRKKEKPVNLESVMKDVSVNQHIKSNFG